MPGWYAVVESKHELQNPTSAEKIRLLGERMELGPGSHVLANQGPDVGTDVAFPVTAGQWRLVLQTIDDGLGVPPLDAVVGWP